MESRSLSLKVTYGVFGLSLGILILSGFDIGSPFLPGGMRLARFFHLLSGYLLLISLPALIYFEVTSRGFKFSPRQRRGELIIYLSLLILLPFQVLSGFSLYFPELPFFFTLNTLAGGLAKMRVFHSSFRWLLMIPIGVYLYQRLLAKLIAKVEEAKKRW